MPTSPAEVVAATIQKHRYLNYYGVCKCKFDPVTAAANVPYMRPEVHADHVAAVVVERLALVEERKRVDNVAGWADYPGTTRGDLMRRYTTRWVAVDGNQS